MAPIRLGGGAGLTPSGFAEWRKGDGTVVWSAGDDPADIPDTELLQAQYDATGISASDGSSLSAWEDSHNDNDLSGTATYHTDVINGHPSVRTDGVEDVLAADFGDSFSEPFAIFAVLGLRTNTTDDYDMIYDGGTADEARFYSGNDDGSWGVYQGDPVLDGVADTDLHVVGTLFDSEDIIRLDGAEVVSGSSGSASLTGAHIGSRASQTWFANADYGEVLFYDDHPNESDVESYLSDKWEIDIE